ncbi:MerR family transcriptional regulator [Ruminococcaceae bacterium OttesenSCG-928-O06]|nr:MerR family transcriptional regulator [Ruminococcaceae bacterium OttesenSCG-928-O06]
MLSSQFAEKHGVPYSVVEFYLKKKLLQPEMRGGRYYFGSEDDDDMQLIQKMKRWGFGLRDIGAALTEQRFIRHSVNAPQSSLLSMLRNQQEVLGAQQASLAAAAHSLNQEIAHLSQEPHTPHTDGSGMSVEFLPLLCCPACGQLLDIYPEGILAGLIVAGMAKCVCGYHADINKGCIVGPATHRHPLRSTDVDYTEPSGLSLTMQEMIYRLRIWINGQLGLGSLSNPVVLEAYCGSLSYLLAEAKQLDTSARYLLCDPDLTFLSRQAEKLAVYPQASSALFVAADAAHLPLRKNSVDVVVDFFQSFYHASLTNEYLFTKLWPILKSGGRLVGCFIDIPPDTETYKAFITPGTQLQSHTLRFSYFTNQLAQAGYRVQSVECLPPMHQSGLVWHSDSDPLQYWLYTAQKI